MFLVLATEIENENTGASVEYIKAVGSCGVVVVVSECTYQGV